VESGSIPVVTGAEKMKKPEQKRKAKDPWLSGE
jgi:hypothetical protein